MKKTIAGILLLLSFYPGQAQDKTPLGSPVNTALGEESKPSLNGNGRIILFESLSSNEDKSEFVISYQKGGAWSRPEAIPALSTPGKLQMIFAPYLSYSGNTIFYSSPKYGGVGGKDIYFIEKTASGWSAPNNLAKPVNSIGDETDPSLSADEKYLYFARATEKKTPSGEPCYKILVSERRAKNQWKDPVELPSPVNMGCDCNPRILADGKSLLFASIRPGGKGDFDLYLTKMDDNGKWSEPVALDFINTDKDDRYASIPANGNIIYTGAPAKVGTDIVKTKIPDKFEIGKVVLINGNLTDATTNKPIDGKIWITTLSDNKIYAVYPSFDGSYTIILPYGEKYDIAYLPNAKGYSFGSAYYDLSQPDSYKEVRSDVKLKALTPGISFIANNISFSSDTSIENISTTDINRINKLIKDNPTLKLEAGIYADIPDITLDDSLQTSVPDSAAIEKFIQALQTALTNGGIATDKITIKVYPSLSDLPKEIEPRKPVVMIKSY
ncbi:MAG TPA: hypothetical protein VIK89_04995 [Cytophagaceae bacterium]